VYTKTINHQDERGKTDYNIYNIEEAKELGIDYVVWHRTEPGKYGCSDDGIVSKLISKKIYDGKNGNKSIYLTFPVGSVFFSLNNKYKKKFNARNIRGPYNTGKRSRLEKRLRTSKARKAAILFAMYPDADMVIDMVLGQHSEATHHSWKRRFRTETFKKMVREELKALLKEKNFEERNVLDLLQETIDLCKSKKDTSTLMRAVSELMELHGMKDKDKTKSTDSIEYTRKQLIDELNQKEEKLKLSREQEVDVGRVKGT